MRPAGPAAAGTKAVEKLLRLQEAPTVHDVEQTVAKDLKSFGATPRLATDVLRSLGQRNRPELAERLLECMLSLGYEVNVIHCSVVLTAYERAQAWQQAVLFQRQMPQMKVQPDTIIFNACISANVVGLQWKQALNLLAHMSSWAQEPGPVSYSTGINACAKGGAWQLGTALLHGMPSAEVLQDVISYCSAITACERAGEWQRALHLLLTSMPGCRLRADEFGYSAAINACGRAEQWEMALFLLMQMPMAGLKAHSISFSAAISACDKGDQWQQALALLEFMPTVRLAPNVYHLSPAVSACGNCGEWQKALDVFASMPRRSVTPNDVSYGAAISAYARGGLWELALSVLFSMSAAQVYPDTIVYSAAISACGKAGEWQLAVGLLGMMADRTVERHVESYGAALGALESCGLWQKAIGLAVEMQQGLLEPNGIAWGSIASSMAKNACHEQAGRLLAEQRKVWAKHYESELSERLLAGSNFIVLGQAPGVLAVFKPAGITSEKLRHDVTEHLRRNGFVGSLTMPSRLDAPTSGVFPLAEPAGANWIQAQFAGRVVRKEYVCLVVGKSLGLVGTEGEIDKPLFQVDSGTVIVSEGGLEARTFYQVQEVYTFPGTSDVLSLLGVQPKTGRHHQIRAHMAGLERPLAGDVAYGGPSSLGAGVRCPRLFLHCRRLALLDLAGHHFEPETELPGELQEVLQALACRKVGDG